VKIRIKELKDGITPYKIGKVGKFNDPAGFADLSGDLIIEKFGTTLRIKGTLDFTSEQQCSRCLTDFCGKFKFPLELYYRTGKLEDTHSGKEFELNSDDLNVIAYNGKELDIWLDIKEALVLSLPLKPLCKEDCKGICPACGKDLNVAPCTCHKDTIDPRWEDLLKLSEKKTAKREK
jgi:uncharacterized protein